jgi:hypothetical protein
MCDTNTNFDGLSEHDAELKKSFDKLYEDGCLTLTNLEGVEAKLIRKIRKEKSEFIEKLLENDLELVNLKKKNIKNKRG